MLKNSEGKEVDAFEQEMEYRISGIQATCTPKTKDKEYQIGMQRGFEYALAIYHECRKDGTT